jgi:predicted NAD/FAD-binding protein
MKIAIVGSGISGLAVAHAMRGKADLTLFEAGHYFGGHTHTVDITLPTANGPRIWGVDTGFLVFNERTYPHLIRLFDELNVKTARTDMSFSVKSEGGPGQRSLEWNGASLNTVFAQRRNLLNWRFIKMLREVLRFNALANQLADSGAETQLIQPLGDFLDANGFGAEFRDWYFLPMMACIWSCPVRQMLQFPVSTMIRFCHNHGLIQVNDRPQWWTVVGGARHYVDKITAGIADKRLYTPVRRIERDANGVTLVTDHGRERFDQVVLATHSDQALALLAQPSLSETSTLSAIRYHANRAVLHTDATVLPAQRRAWAAWNYQRSAKPVNDASQVCLHYLINKLQPIPFEQPVVVSLNPIEPISPEHVLGEYDYAHPVFDLAALKAQAEMPQLQGQQRTWYCGAWMGYGFHEDGLKSGLEVARQLEYLQSALGVKAA